MSLMLYNLNTVSENIASFVTNSTLLAGFNFNDFIGELWEEKETLIVLPVLLKKKKYTIFY